MADVCMESNRRVMEFRPPASILKGKLQQEANGVANTIQNYQKRKHVMAARPRPEIVSPHTTAMANIQSRR
jgi:hypothetical protein